MKKSSSGKKKKASSVFTKDAFSKVFDEVCAEVSSEGGRLGVSVMPPPADQSRNSWRARVSDPLCPVLSSLRELGSLSSDHKALIEAMFRFNLGERRASIGGDDPENALDGRGVLALLLAYYLVLHSENVAKLFDIYPAVGSLEHTGLWHSVEVLSVPEGEPLPLLQVRMRQPRQWGRLLA